MRDVLSPLLSGAPGEDAGTLSIHAGTLTPAFVTLARRRRGRDVALGTLPLDEAPGTAGLPGRRMSGSEALGSGAAKGAVLCLPAEALLEREVRLPSAARRELARAMRYEMDRFTPFRAEELYWSVRAERADAADGTLRARLSLVPRSRLAPLLAALRARGIAPSRLRLPAADGTARVIGLAPPGDGGRWLQRRGAALGLLACAALAAAVLAFPFLRQATAASAIEAEIAALRAEVGRAEALRRQLSDDQAGAGVIAAERARLGDALAVLAGLTEALPDDTFLTALVLRGGRLTIDGRSASPARLIARLSAVPGLRNVAFAAPVTRSDRGTEAFSIVAETGDGTGPGTGPGTGR